MSKPRKPHRGWMAACAIAATLADAAPASAADPALLQNLAPEIARRCVNGVISARDLGEAVIGSGLQDPLEPEYILVSGPRALAARAFADTPGPNRDAYTTLRRLTQTWVDPADPSADDYLPADEGGVAIVERDGSPVRPDRAQDALTAILQGDDGPFAFRCTTDAAPDEPSPGPTSAPSPNRAILAIARSPSELALSLKKKSFAELSFLSDEVADEDSYSIYATAGLSWGEFTPVSRKPGTGGLLLRAIPSAFVQLEREGIGDGNAVDDIDNLNFGAQVSGFLQTRSTATRTHYYALTARFLSDGDLESEAWSAALSITPEFPLPGNDQPYDLVRDRVEFTWLASAVADYFDVVDPGRKSELQGAPQFARLGFDVSGGLRFLLGKDRTDALAFLADYRLREALDDDVGDADLLSLKLLFEPDPRYAFGIAFDRGRNLDSLEFSETWKITLGIKH